MWSTLAVAVESDFWLGECWASIGWGEFILMLLYVCRTFSNELCFTPQELSQEYYMAILSIHLIKLIFKYTYLTTYCTVKNKYKLYSTVVTYLLDYSRRTVTSTVDNIWQTTNNYQGNFLVSQTLLLNLNQKLVVHRGQVGTVHWQRMSHELVDFCRESRCTGTSEYVSSSSVFLFSL